MMANMNTSFQHVLKTSPVTETRSRIVSMRYADAQDAIEEVKDFAVQVECKLVNDMKEIINFRQLEDGILKAAEHFVDKDDDSGRMDLEEDIIKPAKRAVRNISIPRLDFGDTGRYVAKITAKFSGRVEEESLDNLRKAKSAAIETVVKDLENMLKAKINEIEIYLQKSRDEFVTTLVKDIQSELDKYRELLKDKQAALKRLQELKELL